MKNSLSEKTAHLFDALLEKFHGADSITHSLEFIFSEFIAKSEEVDSVDLSIFYKTLSGITELLRAREAELKTEKMELECLEAQ